MSGFYYVDPETYEAHKNDVLRLSNSVQINIQEHLPAGQRRRGLSDREIGEELGLDEHVVREIRVVAERDHYDLDEWQKAIDFKDKACRAFSEQGLSYVFKQRKQQE